MKFTVSHLQNGQQKRKRKKKTNHNFSEKYNVNRETSIVKGSAVSLRCHPIDRKVKWLRLPSAE